MTKDPEMNAILEELVELEEIKRNSMDEINEQMRNNDEGLNDDQVDNQADRPMVVTNINVVPTEPESATRLSSMGRNLNRGPGLDTGASTGVMGNLAPRMEFNRGTRIQQDSGDINVIGNSSNTTT